MKDFLVFLFWPNPGNASYTSPKALVLFVFCALLIAVAVGISFWRKRMTNPQMKKISRSWGTASFWFGLVGLFLVVARVEQIQYLAMRFLWLIWILLAVLYVFIQVKRYRARYYEVLPSQTTVDPRVKYLPKQKRK